jgi:hypothetical protein
MCNEVALDSGFDLSCSGLGLLVGSFERGNGCMGSKNSVNFLIDEQLFVPQMGFSYCVTPRHSKSLCQIACPSLFHHLLCKCKFQLFFFYLVSENFIVPGCLKIPFLKYCNMLVLFSSLGVTSFMR